MLVHLLLFSETHSRAHFNPPIISPRDFGSTCYTAPIPTSYEPGTILLLCGDTFYTAENDGKKWLNLVVLSTRMILHITSSIAVFQGPCSGLSNRQGEKELSLDSTVLRHDREDCGAVPDAKGSKSMWRTAIASDDLASIRGTTTFFGVGQKDQRFEGTGYHQVGCIVTVT
ncbi:predicted protein [Plenodomus lingam JN3]|uniref:Predicted protein n=1 Tax=Leptosphaeria maculans (strain JN3 / isolate v23.1.3 / race Av1-4-5-6-7-8) TaxID=985895 RepID=E4ZWD8_LEPMJ|nr:predicted protein [Plenodomus lingam JN3]CBX95914.1 predicted protein [Plenodomus lingam JN3]